ncbi:MAG: M48 family metallopeptidase [Treponema sp.]|nr:M48 family metallopeptidase [Treponema sp.]
MKIEKRKIFISLPLAFAMLTALMFTSCSTLARVISSIEQPIYYEEEDDDKNGDEAIADAVVTGIDGIIKAAEDNITPEEAYYIGRTVAAIITKNYKVYDAPEATAYLNKICTAITINSAVPYLYKGYYVAILDSDEINALATPGGHIFVTRGLLKCTDSEDAVAAVLAHEISHIQLNHSIKAIKSSRVTSATMQGVKGVTTSVYENSDPRFQGLVSQEDLDYLTNAGDEIVKTLVDSGFSVTQEFDADRNALMLMSDSGYDPEAMNDMLDLLERNIKEGDSGWSKTHPSPSARKRNVKNFKKKYTYKGSSKKNRQKRFDELKEYF